MTVDFLLWTLLSTILYIFITFLWMSFRFVGGVMCVLIYNHFDLWVFPHSPQYYFFFSAQNYAFKSYISTYPSPINIQGTASDLSASEWADQFNCYQYFMTLASIALFGGRVWVMAIFCVYKYFIAHLAWWSE